MYVKSDVYGFGVVLLEIITGLRVLDLNRPCGQANLVDWALPSLTDKKKLRKIMDPRLQGQYPSKAARGIAELVLKCIEPDPKYRPDMEVVLETLEQISSIQTKPKKLKRNSKQEQTHKTPANHTYHGSGGARGGATAHQQRKKSTPSSY